MTTDTRAFQTIEEIQKAWLQTEFPYLNLAKLEDVFEEFNIPEERRSELAYDLNDARAEYEIHRIYMGVPVPSAVLKFQLGSVQNPVSRIAKVTNFTKAFWMTEPRVSSMEKFLSIKTPRRRTRSRVIKHCCCLTMRL